MFGLVPLYRNPVLRKQVVDFNNLSQLADQFFKDDLWHFNDFTSNLFKLDVQEFEDYYLIEAELPGVEKDQIEIHYDNHYLNIDVKQEVNETIPSEGKYLHRERKVNAMSRSLYLKSVDQNNIDASLTNGILRMTLPKLKENLSKTQITIK